MQRLGGGGSSAWRASPAGRRANIIVATLVIIAILVGGALLVMQSRSPMDRERITSTLSLFHRFIFSRGDELVREYALNGYTANDSPWMCAGTPTPPAPTRVTGDFDDYSDGEMKERLNALLAAEPSIGLNVSDARFELEGAPYSDTLVTVNVTEFNVTVRDGATNLTIQVGGEQDYNLRFWQIHKVLSDWTYCANQNVYQPLQVPASRHACSFYKDICPGPPQTEVCTSPDGKKMQDFTLSDRASLASEYGIGVRDLREAMNYSTLTLNAYFNGSASCKAPRLAQDSGIKCTAQLRETDLKTDFWTTYVKIGCSDRRKMAAKNSCKITPYNQTNQTCKMLIDAQSQGWTNDWALIDEACAHRASIGTLGMQAEALGVTPLCAPNATPPLPTTVIDREYYDRDVIVQPGTPKGFPVKCMKDDPDRLRIIGTLGFMDTSGDYEMLITCTDPGSPTSQPLTAEVRMHIAFRYVCDTRPKTLIDSVPCPEPPGIAASGGPTVCEYVVCPKAGECEPENECIVNDKGQPECKPTGVTPSSCTPPGGGNACKEYKCMADGSCQEMPANSGSCGGGCGRCSNGDCIQADGQICPSGTMCRENRCKSWSCEPAEPKNDGVTCAQDNECSKTCSGGLCSNPQGTTCTAGTCDDCGSTYSLSGECVDPGGDSIICRATETCKPVCGGQICCSAEDGSSYCAASCTDDGTDV